MNKIEIKIIGGTATGKSTVGSIIYEALKKYDLDIEYIHDMNSIYSGKKQYDCIQGIKDRTKIVMTEKNIK